MIWLIYISSATKVQLFADIQKNIKKTNRRRFGAIIFDYHAYLYNAGGGKI